VKTMDMATLCGDLLLETEALEEIVVPLSEEEWAMPTPAPKWSVRDQITHLAYFDEATILAATDPEAFGAARAEVLADIDALTDQVVRRYRLMPGSEVLSWFREARQRFVDLFGSLDSKARIPWYGPDMSAASAITARIMETWAHGQDIADGLGVPRRVTRALHDVAHLGVRTFANSFIAHQRLVPAGAVRVELIGPDGETWEWGPLSEQNAIRGPAIEFCLVVTQRLHVADSSLRIEGNIAEEWMSIAQAFAGPPGAGRPRSGA
jgi:uncharacterized protein (TIGR03084 family)